MSTWIHIYTAEIKIILGTIQRYFDIDTYLNVVILIYFKHAFFNDQD